ncbi:hypothetical protein DW083_10905 [Parabacteroides sp. AF48-14]|uniref:hypothetical protein n=1 Tax=Parabacteroides sp. AF48-14 TaxID=2292052 RepID=UPI000EFF5834|nr:hypothetical protein [Parabacteroides sp. AF48-14]RHO71569.1 hypothetical protein DW083_10905 [Parabacteroides sp. AF48-14]
MTRKYIKPFVCISVPLVGLSVGLLALGRYMESDTANILFAVGSFCLSGILLWKLLFRHWSGGPYWKMANHIIITNVTLFLTSVCLLYGSLLMESLKNILVFVPALISYTFGLGYVCLFAKRNENVYLRKRYYRSKSLPLKPFLRDYLPGFLWVDLFIALFTIILLLLFKYVPVIAEYDGVVFILIGIATFYVSDKFWKYDRLTDLLGFRSYPFAVFRCSTVMLIISLYCCLKEEYGLFLLVQFVALGCYLHAFYIYEQEKNNKRCSDL